MAVIIDQVIQPTQRQPIVDKQGLLQKALYDFLGGLWRARVIRGTGDPSGVVVADVGTLYTRLDGGVGTTLYVKQADSGLSSGWAAK